ncbi:hypothetical protein [Sphingomonas pruni]|uniref:hypothetical protein n=1 Tax=Sphingomonas pruni TaxID=40683 RepID=UPI00082A720B|nr:hypothetical protein [Sphingomonas pruni]
MRKAIILLGLAAIAAAPASPVTSLAGRYSKHFQNGMVDGSKFWSDDVVEIVPVDAAHAYFRAELAFYNGHSCSIAGVAKAVGNKLVYREKQASYDGGPTCRLTITTKGKSLLLDDGDGSCQSYCGARGSLSGFDFIPLSSKRPISYMARLKGSSQYKGAIDAWQSGKTD